MLQPSPDSKAVDASIDSGEEIPLFIGGAFVLSIRFSQKILSISLPEGFI